MSTWEIVLVVLSIVWTLSLLVVVAVWPGDSE